MYLVLNYYFPLGNCSESSKKIEELRSISIDLEEHQGVVSEETNTVLTIFFSVHIRL